MQITQITQIDLENVKSYAQAQITFKPGTNAICGQNGAGKSSILEAIGFALFDYGLTFTQDDFVREGEKTAMVTVHVVDREGRAYQIVRKCGSYSRYHVYDPELERQLTDSKADTVAWLRDFLGVDAATDLTALFEDAVGVPQGKLTAAFLETPRRREDVFNPLLRVDEYEAVWSDLRETGRWLDDQISDREKRIAGLEGELKVLPDRRTKAATLAQEVAAGEEKQAALEAQLADVSTQKAELEAVKDRLDALDKDVTAAEAQVETLTARLGDAKIAVEEARQAQEILDKTEAGFEAYERAKAALQELETKREARDWLQTELQACKKQLALARQNEERLQTELEEIAEAEAKMAQLQPQVEGQEELESALQEAERNATRLHDVQESLDREQARLQELREQLTQTQADLKERATVEGEIETLEEQQAALEARREDLRDRLGDLEAQAAQLEERHAQAVKAQEAAQADHQEARAEAAQLEHRLTDLRRGVAERQELEARIAAYRASLETADADYATLSSEIVAQRTRLKQVAARLDALATTDDKAACPVCERTLTPEHRRELVERYEKEQATLMETLEALEGEQAQLEQKRRAFKTLVEEWTADLEMLPRPPGSGQPCRTVGTTAAGCHRTATGPRQRPGAPGGGRDQAGIGIYCVGGTARDPG
jgi:exonuclease SbcC